MSYSQLDPSEQVLRLSEAAGFLPEQTGGGCTALQKLNDDGSYILITRIDDPSIPSSPAEPVEVSWYEGEHGYEYRHADYQDLATALDHLLTPAHKEEK